MRLPCYYSREKLNQQVAIRATWGWSGICLKMGTEQCPAQS